MAQTKKMNESFFAKLLKDFDVTGELIRSRQDEKQGIIDEFNSECKRFFFGKISERALISSVKKTNNELNRLDAEIRRNIIRARNWGDRAKRLVSAQAPIGFRATMTGIIDGSKKAKKSVRKKPVARKPAKKKVVKKKVIPKKPTKKKK